MLLIALSRSPPLWIIKGSRVLRGGIPSYFAISTSEGRISMLTALSIFQGPPFQRMSVSVE